MIQTVMVGGGSNLIPDGYRTKNICIINLGLVWFGYSAFTSIMYTPLAFIGVASCVGCQQLPHLSLYQEWQLQL